MQCTLVRLPCLAGLLLLFTMSGCSTTHIEVPGHFPKTAAIERLPLTIGVHFNEDFQNFTLEESIPQRGSWNIAIGAAQMAMFRFVLPAMFEHVLELDDPTDAADLDAVLVPQIDEMQFAIPFQTKTNFFEVWIRYRLTLREPAGGPVIATWPLTAYGRTRSAMLEGASSALAEAAVFALRDAAAFLAIDFTRTRELAPWLADKLPGEPHTATHEPPRS